MPSDYLVTVCAACRTAACCPGEFYCQSAKIAGTADIPASVLRQEKNEHPGNFSRRKLTEVCGAVREVNCDR